MSKFPLLVVQGTGVLPLLRLFLNMADLPSYVLGVCDRPFTTVNFGAAQVSCSAYETICTW